MELREVAGLGEAGRDGRVVPVRVPLEHAAAVDGPDAPEIGLERDRESGPEDDGLRRLEATGPGRARRGIGAGSAASVEPRRDRGRYEQPCEKRPATEERHGPSSSATTTKTDSARIVVPRSASGPRQDGTTRRRSTIPHHAEHATYAQATTRPSA